jgi:hypothetical protein
MGEVDQPKLETFVGQATASGGSEMSNHQLFVERLTGALRLYRAVPAEFAVPPKGSRATLDRGGA